MLQRYFKQGASLLLLLCLLLTGCQTATPPTAQTTSNDATTAAPLPNTTQEDDPMSTPNPLMWEYTTDANGVVVRNLHLSSVKGGDPLTILQLSDIHFNFINDRDRAENHELVIGSYENLNFLRDGKQLPNLERCLAYAEGVDQLIVTGDAISYLSYGNLEAVQTYLWSKYPEAIITMGNHDPLRSWNGAADESATLEQRLKRLEEFWKHDIYYSSKVLNERIMLIQMDNGTTGEFWDHQIEPFQKDLALAREKGYTVLLFYHIPLSTGNVADFKTPALMVGDSNTATWNFYTKGIGKLSTGASKEIYDLIINNADIIAGAFCGHKHSDFYTEILAKTAAGEDAIIPQYTLMGLFYGKGHVLKITIE